MAYGARLESVLGASPRGFESPILRHRTPGPLQVPGFLLPVAPLVFQAPLVFLAPSGPAAREIATREPAARSGRSRSPPVPSGPSGALHTGGAWSTDVWFGASPRSPDRPRHRPPTPRQIPPAPSAPAALGVLTCGSVRWVEAWLWLSISNFARNSSMAHSNFEFIALELQRF